MFTGFEADLIQGRGGIALGFANPAVYDMADTPAFHDFTGSPGDDTVSGLGSPGPRFFSSFGSRAR